ncbi:MAG TPA: hypothetical protein VI685_26655 [Candidatus Angelobacter sp.]
MKNLRQHPHRRMFLVRLCFMTAMLLMIAAPSLGQARVIEVMADKDSHFRIPGQSRPEITMRAGESLLLRIQAHKGKTWNRDGAVHGFTMIRAKDRAKVPGWDFELRPGVQEFALTAPSEAGEYEVLCTVICSSDHEGMRLKVSVLP